jgi:glucose/arabinose dehydrogenase
MSSDLSFIDYSGLALYVLYLSSMLGGLWVMRRRQQPRRWLGLVWFGEAIIAMGLLTWMSTKYWITGGYGVIGMSLRPLLWSVSAVLAALIGGFGVFVGNGYIALKLSRRQQRVFGIVLPSLLLPIIFAVSTAGLMVLTKQNEPQLPDPQHDEIHITTGFTLTLFSRGPAQNPTSIITGPNHTLYVADYNGDIWVMDLTSGKSLRYATGLWEPVGLAWHDNLLYVATHGKVSILHDHNGDGYVDEVQDIITGLPSHIYPWHSNNGLAFGPDGRLYFAVGSTTDSLTETHPLAAVVLSAKPDGTDLRVFATGVRNPYRLAFNAAGDLFATDNGPDSMAHTPGDELNYIVEGGNYGFPQSPEHATPGSPLRDPIALFPPHASANGIVFYYAKQFPAQYYGNAFVTLWNRGEIYRVQLGKAPSGDYMTFLSMFVSGLKRPLDMTIDEEGRLYVADFETNAIYRIMAVP